MRSTDELCDRYFCWRYVALCCQLLCERTSQVYWTCGDMRRPAGGLILQETGDWFWKYGGSDTGNTPILPHDLIREDLGRLCRE
jgi:hypothetical protein